jgi:hypothetical protein
MTNLKQQKKKQENALPAAAIDPSTDKWHYVSI